MAVMAEVVSTTGAPLGSPASLPPPAAAVKDADAEKLQFIEEMTSDVDAVQERVLGEILARNADTEYLAKYGLIGASDRATFRAKVPMATYEDLQPYIRRIADGDRSPILSGHPVSEFLTSSGTSAGERKLMPTIEDELNRRQLLYSLQMPVMNLYVPGMDKGKALHFLFVKSETKTPGGLAARPVLTSYYKSNHFKNRPFDAYNNYTSPTAAILCADAFQSMYAQMVCGLCQRQDVLRVGAVFASGLLRAIRFLQLNWEQLADDIEGGSLSPRVTDPSVREAVAGILRPDPELAELVRSECSKGDWAGIIPRIWPNTKYLDVIVTGAMAQYIPTLKYYSGGLPMACTMYASSECYFGLNLRPMCDPSEVSYTLMPNMCYFEFLPMDAAASGGGDASQLVDLARVEVGREYELVITTYAGLNRYRVGDVLQVTGFHNTAPQFRFVRRKNVLLSIEVRQDGRGRAAARRGARVRAAPPARRRRGPAAGAAVDRETLDRCCLEMEEALNTVYRQSRVADGSIGPLEIRVVRPGTFEELMDYAISRGASINQYKVPRCVTFPPIIELLDSRVVSTHFSPALPHWTPGQRSHSD
ncbi:unnamed protein product [Miscanthus lutarioriparius]|uniref:Uncharacterized protein n=1 Tax=Miscanthus lutarioriparius TaxID=422564 RepID=A0A811NIG3_9POAL|nr:unnamed protein product [Miscanthus lutarioriparius]